MSQIAVSVFGLSALWLVMDARLSVRRWAVVLGLLGQPAWYTQLVIHEQWGMMPVFVGYTASWLRGAWTLWCRPALATCRASAENNQKYNKMGPPEQKQHP